MRKGKKTKCPFAGLDDGFKDMIAGMTNDEIRSRIADIAISFQELMEEQKEDQDLAEKKAAHDVANEVYKEGKKFHTLKIKFARSILSARGNV